jgi:oligopeptide/dipeptide ABC transporter ATP-binding protein
MILNPKLLVCDEPVSSLDVSIQGQIVNLLSDLQSQCGTAMLFISHNLRVIRHLSDRIMVLYRGRCIELSPRADLFAAALHPYTQALLAAATGLPAAGLAPADPAAAGSSPARAQAAAAAGCSYRDRCGFAIGICETVVPPLSEIVPQRFAACHRAREFCERRPV